MYQILIFVEQPGTMTKTFGEIRHLPFFFIIGRPRSGTTLLSTLLDAHPSVNVPPEYAVLLNLYRKFPGEREWDEPAFKAFLDAFYSPISFDAWKSRFLTMDPAVMAEVAPQVTGKARFDEVYRVIYYCYRSIFGGKDVALLGDKNPFYAIYTARLLKIFPGAKVVMIFRDYRDNFTSLKRFQFEGHNVALQTWRWRYLAKKYFTWSRRFPGQVMKIRYEDLVNDTERTMQEVCSFLSIPWDPSVLDFFNRTREHFREIEATLSSEEKEFFLHVHGNLLNGINPASIGVWKTRMTAEEIRQADAIAGKWADTMGYERTTRDFSLPLLLKSLPYRIYGRMLYSLMLGGEHLPYSWKVALGKNLPRLARTYNRILGREK